MSEFKFTSENWQSEVMESPIPVVVDFFATWCGPCREYGPIVEKMADKYALRVKIGKLDVDENREISHKYSVHSIPHTFFFKNGVQKDSIGGGMSENELESAIEKLINS